MSESTSSDPFRRRAWLTALATLGACVAALIVAPAAHADASLDPGTGSDITDSSVVQVLSEQAAAKLAVTQEFYKVAYQGADRAALDKLEAAYVDRFGGSGHTDALTGTKNGISGAALAPASRNLSVSHTGQQNGYFCGPASGFMIVRDLHGASYTSRYNGNSLSQGSMGNSAHMNTASAGTTAWTSGKFTLGVNRWRGVNWYVQVPKPSASLLPQILTHSIGNNGMPVAADTVEFAGGYHYNGHPNRTIGHWIVAEGYASSGATSYWVDPSTTVFANANPRFSYASGTFASRFLQSNGVAY